MALVKCKECSSEISTNAKECPKCGAPVKKKTSRITWMVSILAFLFVLGVVNSPTTNTTKPETTSRAEPTPRVTAMKETKLDFTWKKAGFDNVMEATFTIQNKSKYNIKDITIQCIHSAKSGTVIDTNKQTIFDVVKANSTKKFPEINMGFINSQAHSSSCSIIDLAAG